ncbi:hypothetical protein [Streptomyces sp. NPDC047042]|uniref:hypothetical protein n=1 Tax=Streptomyces sp. NPDC047042 TaxID=3154807 RepID=UPI0033F5F73F
MMTAVFDQGVLPLAAQASVTEPDRIPPLLLAGEDDEEAVASDSHIVRGID